eukprot:12343648-Ditylum_brightwellii.AAC.1
MEKATSASTTIKEHDYEKLRTLLGWLPLEVIKQSLGCTMQLVMGSLIHLPFRQHHKSRSPQLNIPRLAEPFATDLLFSSEPSSKLTKVFGMKTENEGPNAFEDFIQDNGALYTLKSDNATMQTGASFRNILCKYISGLRAWNHINLNRIQQKGASK